MFIQHVTLKLYRDFKYSEDKGLLEVLFDGKPGKTISLGSLNPNTFQMKIDTLKEDPLVERSGICCFHKGICRDIVYDRESQKFYCVLGMTKFPVSDFAEGNVLFAKYIADTMIIPKTVDAVSGIDFLITEDEEVYTAWPTLMSVY